MYVKEKLIDKLEPFILGGEMNARFNPNMEVTYKDFPLSFEGKSKYCWNIRFISSS